VIDNKSKDNNEVYSQKIRAGKRSYFFDVKATKGNDYYITITECKKKSTVEGVMFEKHKIFLYKEDVVRFYEALQTTIEKLKEELPDFDFEKGNSEYSLTEETNKDLNWD
jgi:hypothetical protein